MSTAAAAILGGLVGSGLWVAWEGWQGRRVLPDTRLVKVRWSREQVAAGAGALAVGLTVWAATGWPAAGAFAGMVVVAAPSLLGGKESREDDIALGEAIAAWTEMLRDAIAGGAQLPAAINATAKVAPDRIATEVQAVVERRRHMELWEALVLLGEELDHPAGDRLVVVLARATGGEQVSALDDALSRLAAVMRDNAKMRRDVEESRSKIRTAVKTVLGASAVLLVLLASMSQGLLAAYDSLTGQVVLAVVGAIFLGAGWWLHRLMDIDTPGGFSARRAAVTGGRR